MFRTIATFALVSVAALSASTVSAAGADSIAVGEPGPREERIDYSRVDFRDARQAKAFYRSLQYAAARVCADESRACHADVVDDAVSQINQRELTALHGGDAATQMARSDNSPTAQR